MGFWRAENVLRCILYRAEQNQQLPNASHAFRVGRIPPPSESFMRGDRRFLECITLKSSEDLYR